MQDSMCIKCGTKIQCWSYRESIKCKCCGALYEIENKDVGDQEIEFTYKFLGFKCIYSSALDSCDNTCPAPQMFCKEHTSDDSFAAAKKSIEYAENRLELAKETLNQMEESKKTWLIQEVSGIDEDSSV
jgi:hypothetical protein